MGHVPPALQSHDASRQIKERRIKQNYTQTTATKVRKKWMNEPEKLPKISGSTVCHTMSLYIMVFNIITHNVILSSFSHFGSASWVTYVAFLAFKHTQGKAHSYGKLGYVNALSIIVTFTLAEPPTRFTAMNLGPRSLCQAPHFGCMKYNTVGCQYRPLIVNGKVKWLPNFEVQVSNIENKYIIL